MKNRFIIISFLLFLFGSIIYFYEVLPLLKGFIIKNECNWVSAFIQYLYPKIEIYKNTIDSNALINRANQLIYRSGFILIGVNIIYYYRYQLNIYFNNVNFYPKHIEISYFIYSLYFLYTCFDWVLEIPNLFRLAEFHTPLYPTFIFGNSLPSPYLFAVVFLIGTAGLVLTRSDQSKTKSIGAIMMLFNLLFLHSTFCSFGKIDHGYATYFIIAMILPVYFWTNDHRFIRFIQIAITLCYAMSGLEKITLSGIDFINPDHFKNILFMHPTSIGNWIKQYDVLCFIIPTTTLLIQLSAPFIFFKPKLIPLWVISAILFHWGAYLIMNIGGFHSPWVAALAIFIPSCFQKKKLLAPILPLVKKE